MALKVTTFSTGHEKNCRVKVTIEDEGKRYAIIRHRKHKEFKTGLLSVAKTAT